MCRGFEIETVLASDFYSVLLGQYKRHFMLLTIYDPDIAVLAEQRLHDGNANAINGGIAGGDNKAIEYHCFASETYGEDAAEQSCNGIEGKENGCQPYKEESRPCQRGEEQLSSQGQRCCPELVHHDSLSKMI